MEFSEFKKKIDSENSFSICLFEGEETFLAEEGLVNLKEKFVNYPELDYVRIDGADVTVDELVSHVTAFPFIFLGIVMLEREVLIPVIITVFVSVSIT